MKSPAGILRTKKKFREPAGTEKKVPEGETKKAALIKIQ